MYVHYHEKISFSLNYVHLLQCIEWMHVVVLYVRAHSFSVTRLKKSGWVGLQSAPECKIRCNFRKIQFLPESISLCIYQFISLKRVCDFSLLLKFFSHFWNTLYDSKTVSSFKTKLAPSAIASKVQKWYSTDTLNFDSGGKAKLLTRRR